MRKGRFIKKWSKWKEQTPELEKEMADDLDALIVYYTTTNKQMIIREFMRETRQGI